MSADYPIIGPAGGIRLEAVIRDGEFHLVLGRVDEAGAPELVVAICALADMASVLDSAEPVRRAAESELNSAIRSLHDAGRRAVRS